MTFELFDPGFPVGDLMPDGMYLVVMDQPLYKVDTFDMNKTFSCDEADISVYSGKKLADLDHEDRGLWKISTAANVLVFSGEEEGFPVHSNIIYQNDEHGKKMYGLLIGRLDTEPKEIRHKIISCVNNGIQHITKDMWYIHEKKSVVSTELEEKERGGQKRKLPACVTESKGET